MWGVWGPGQGETLQGAQLRWMQGILSEELHQVRSVLLQLKWKMWSGQEEPYNVQILQTAEMYPRGDDDKWGPDSPHQLSADGIPNIHQRVLLE